MGRELLKRSMVVIALDTELTTTAVKIGFFLREELKAVQLADTVYEFDYENCPWTLFDLRKRLAKMMDPENDMIYIWDLDRPNPDADNELFRTIVG